MGKPLRLLLVEDSEDDALLTILALEKGGYDPVHERVENPVAMRKALLEKSWNVILCDYQMPQFNGPSAIAILKETGVDIPLIIVSGAIGEETAVECMRLGACDYIMKSNLSRLASAIQRELKEAESRLQRKRSEEALRESEAKFRSMMESMTDPIFICSPEFTVEYMNPAMVKRTGRDAVGEKCYSALHDLSAVCDWCVFDDVIAGKSLETNIVSPKDNRNYRVTNMPIKNKDGSVSKMTIFRDITDYLIAVAEKEKVQAQLHQAQKMESIGSLAGGIAHDLNNILFPISGLSEMLLDDIPPDTPEHESIEQIYKSAQRGSDLVKQILSFSRQSNPLKLPIRIQPILNEVLKLAQATIPRNIEITSQINTDCGMVSADPTQVHQIVMNLITNAYHAVEEKGGTINLELKEKGIGYFGEKDDLRDITMKSAKHACITISDNGTGIDRALIDKIFDPYFTTKVLGKGTGLGLSVVHGIVKEHGGDILVYSEVGKGTTFNVYLPLLKDSRDSKTSVVSKKHPTGRESILLVDDEEPIARMLSMMLEKLGYQVTTRTSCLDALDTFRANSSKYDLVISDRGMPNMTGEQLAKELILIKPGIPIIICTGYSYENDVKSAKAMGVKGFLMKPVAIGDLAEMVRKVLDEVKVPNQ